MGLRCVLPPKLHHFTPLLLLFTQKKRPVPNFSFSLFFFFLHFLDNITALLLIAHIEDVRETDPNALEVDVSPFRLKVKVPGYKMVSLYLPTAIQPARSRIEWSRPCREGEGGGERDVNGDGDGDGDVIDMRKLKKGEIESVFYFICSRCANVCDRFVVAS
jgi:hypothetical protein